MTESTAQNSPSPFGEVSAAVWDNLSADDDWRRRCRKRLKKLGLNQYDLANYLRKAEGETPGKRGRGSQSGVSQALSLKNPQDSSRYVHAISLALGEDLPLRARLELAVRELERAGRTATILKYVDLLEDAAEREREKPS